MFEDAAAGNLTTRVVCDRQPPPLHEQPTHEEAKLMSEKIEDTLYYIFRDSIQDACWDDILGCPSELAFLDAHKAFARAMRDVYFSRLHTKKLTFHTLHQSHMRAVGEARILDNRELWKTYELLGYKMAHEIPAINKAREEKIKKIGQNQLQNFIR